MNKNRNQKLRSFRFVPVPIILLGFLLMIYMILVEDEPGALPLFLIISGSVWFVIIQVQLKRQEANRRN